jgi:hypothetical protein
MCALHRLWQSGVWPWGRAGRAYAGLHGHGSVTGQRGLVTGAVTGCATTCAGQQPHDSACDLRQDFMARKT